MNGGRGRLLLVEDDEASRGALSALLDAEGYVVLTAGTLGEADAALEAGAPALVVLDVMLPDGDGAAWLARCRARAARMPPVVALTGVTRREDVRRIRESGARTVLSKPVDIRQLLTEIEAALTSEARE
ncbi:MAG: response regulator [Syntrophomonadaceae bacterium]